MKKYFKRYLALVLTFALVLAVPFVFTQQADAAAKKSKKTVKYTQTVKKTYTYKNEKNKTVKEVTKYSYNKNGFLTKAYQKGKDGFKRVYKYNKKGYVKSAKMYNAKGKLTGKLTVKMNKSGMPIEAKSYTVNGKKSTLDGTVKFIYSGKNPVKYVTSFGDETETEEFFFYEVGEDERATYKETWDGMKNIKKDKKGRITSYTSTYTDTDEESGVTETDTDKWTRKYNKAGYITKETWKNTYTTKDAQGTSTFKSTTVLNYKTFKYTKKVAKLASFNNRILGDLGFLWY